MVSAALSISRLLACQTTVSRLSEVPFGYSSRVLVEKKYVYLYNLDNVISSIDKSLSLS